MKRNPKNEMFSLDFLIFTHARAHTHAHTNIKNETCMNNINGIKWILISREIPKLPGEI